MLSGKLAYQYAWQFKFVYILVLCTLFTVLLVRYLRYFNIYKYVYDQTKIKAYLQVL